MTSWWDFYLGVVAGLWVARLGPKIARRLASKKSPPDEPPGRPHTHFAATLVLAKPRNRMRGSDGWN